MKTKRIWMVAVTLAVLLGVAGAEAALTPKQMLGRRLYMDTSLSLNQNQSCMTCHHPMAGWADPDNTADPENSVVSTGSDNISLGGREAPPAAYAAFSPVFGYEKLEDKSRFYTGGQFWDGRAATLANQAKGPFLNPGEMAMPTKAAVVAAVMASSYASDFIEVFGKKAFDKVDRAYDYIAEAIADFETTEMLNRFSSRYDAYLAGQATLNELELWGLQLFEDPAKGNCAACHPSQPDPATGALPVFTDFSYDNLGMPKSANPQIAGNPTDYGLGGRADIAAFDPLEVTEPTGEVVTVSAGQAGKFKVPSLRNIAKTAPYGHNGYFATLEGIIQFYNTAGVPEAGWPAPEVDLNVNRSELGDLGLTPAEVAAIAAFLGTLSDSGMMGGGPGGGPGGGGMMGGN